MQMVAPLNLNDDFSRRVVAPIDDAAWAPSPQPGVERRMLDRVGGEVARATSVVRYAPNSRFERHVHGGGEEILVLEGVFSDEAGDYPAGTYLRNPPGSAHAPFSREGCVLFVKLWQFAPGDLQTVRIDTLSEPWRAGLVPGLSVMPLHRIRRRQHGPGEMGAADALQHAHASRRRGNLRARRPVPGRGRRLSGRHLAAQPALEPPHAVHWRARARSSMSRSGTSVPSS
jgi:hypothetical protein